MIKTISRKKAISANTPMKEAPISVLNPPVSEKLMLNPPELKRWKKESPSKILKIKNGIEIVPKITVYNKHLIES